MREAWRSAPVVKHWIDAASRPGHAAYHAGMEALVLSKVPELKERIEGATNRLKKKEFLNVLKYLVEKSQIDHIWSSACDAPPQLHSRVGPGQQPLQGLQVPAGQASPLRRHRRARVRQVDGRVHRRGGQVPLARLGA